MTPSLELSQFEKKLFRLCDASGEMQFTLEAKGSITRSMLDTKDVFIFDAGFEVFVWIGKGATVFEKLEGFNYAQRYLHLESRPATLPITRILEGGDSSPIFDLAFSPEAQDLTEGVRHTIARAMRMRRQKQEESRLEAERLHNEKKQELQAVEEVPVRVLVFRVWFSTSDSPLPPSFSSSSSSLVFVC